VLRQKRLTRHGLLRIAMGLRAVVVGRGEGRTGRSPARPVPYNSRAGITIEARAPWSRRRRPKMDHTEMGHRTRRC